MKIELLYFEDCPSWCTTKQYLNEIMENFSVDSSITLIRVESNADAVKRKFTGSPTIRLDGVDLFPVDHTDYALGCRVYETPQGLKGSPTKEMIRGKLKDHINGSSGLFTFQRIL